MTLKGPIMATATSKQVEELRRVLSYPLVDALVHRRSRRFSRGATLNGGGLAYEGKQAPLPLSKLEEALLAFAAAGISGFTLADVPYDSGQLHEAGGGNILATLTGRTVASADAIHGTALFVINDEGTYLLRRPQEFSLDELNTVRQMAVDQRFEDLYERMRIRIHTGRTSIPREVPFVFPFNKWSTNLPGTTYFLPVGDLTGMYINLVLSALDEQALFFVDERNMFRPAGLKRFAKSRGGRLHDDLKDNRVVPILNFEVVAVEFLMAEQAAMLHNLGLMEQAIGLGGWTHFSSGAETAWVQSLGFRMSSQRISQILRAGFFRRLLLRLVNQDKAIPYPLGLTIDGVDLVKPFCPPYYRSMEDAVLAWLELKEENIFQAPLEPVYPASWKDPKGVQAKIPKVSDECIEATIAYCTYIYETYGRFPAYFGPIRTTLAHQAHHLELEFYDKFYQPGAYTETQAHHIERWH